MIYVLNFQSGLTIDRDLNAAINVVRRGMQSLEENETEYVGRGTPEFTPVEIGSIPERANPVVETGSSLRQLREDVTFYKLINNLLLF
ncbi:MAG: hypothetical protein ACYCWJ_10700 [Thermoplasmataceae archaeon]